MEKPFIPVRSLLLWVLTFAPILLTSYISPNLSDQADHLPAGTCHLILSKGLRADVRGSMQFDTSVKKGRNGRTYSVITLQMDNAHTGNLKSLGFLISRPNQANSISRGTYKIGRRSQGFLPYFDGIFGFANSELAGELPFFASEGTITITHADSVNLTGTIEVAFMNLDSKRLIIKGIFKASKAELR